jgi:AcrR family transcriptional regulator
MGLREQKKLATRDALSSAAWHMMVEQGIEAVTPESVAEVAGVSPRTFRNYFASREEAILDEMVRRGSSILDEIGARPADEPLWDCLMAVLPDVALIGSREDFAVMMRVCQENPAMLAQHLVVFERSEAALVEVIAQRTGTDAKDDLAPRLVAATTLAVVRTAIEVWAQTQTDTTLADLIREGLAQLRAGLPLAS